VTVALAEPFLASDPLMHPDPDRVADVAATEVLLRCWIRETGCRLPTAGSLRLELATTGIRLEVPILYRSACSWHRLGIPCFESGAEADAATVAAVLTRELAARRGEPSHAGAELIARVLDSTRRMAAHVRARRASPDDLPGTTPFLAAEQALILGHPFHPTPKSREGASDAETAALSPELRGSFPLHWFAAHRSVVASDSALGRPAGEIVGSLTGDTLALPPETVAVPAHPWQARDLAQRPGIQALLADGTLHDLGPAGPPWFPTSSLRTVYRPDSPVMLKLSLGLRITNSRRNNRRAELELGVQVHRLLESGLEGSLREVHPSFRIVRDPAWIAVNVPGEAPEGGLETAVRENPFGPGVPVACVASLVAERPDRGYSHLATLIHRLASRHGRDRGDVAGEWFGRYLKVVALPALWLYAAHGIGLEGHQQNILVTLDTDGWPAGGWYRDNQGYYLAASRAAALLVRLPGAADGLSAVFDDALVDERVGYYLGVNNLLGLVGAFGSQGLAQETDLLVRLRRALLRFATDHRPAPGVVHSLLEAPVLRCKANLLTSLDGRDELEGDVENQSIYVEIPNPLAEVRG
jgi:siderophore synthetase component